MLVLPPLKFHSLESVEYVVKTTSKSEKLYDSLIRLGPWYKNHDRWSGDVCLVQGQLINCSNHHSEIDGELTFEAPFPNSRELYD